jgi:tight adherence protein B
LLATLAHVIRERYRVRGIIAALTAEGRMQARVLIAMPFVLLLLLSLVNPAYTGQLYGRSWLLVVAGTLIVSGWAWMRRIVNFRY